MARLRRAVAMRVALCLLSAAFPGSNRDRTSARVLYLETSVKQLRRTPTVTMALQKLREPFGLGIGLGTSALHSLLKRCAAILHGALTSVGGELDASMASLEALRRLHTAGGGSTDAGSSGVGSSGTGCSGAGSSGGLATAPPSARPSAGGVASTGPAHSQVAAVGDRPSALKRRREALGHAATAGGSGAAAAASRSQLADAAISWFEKFFDEHDTSKREALCELWFCDPAVSEWLPEAFCPTLLQSLRQGMHAVAVDAAKAKKGR